MRNRYKIFKVQNSKVHTFIQVDGPLDSSSGSSTSAESSESPKAKKIKMLNDQDFFAPIGDIEENLIHKRQNLETYVGNLKTRNGFKVLPNGYLVMLESDTCNQILTVNEKNFVYVRMLRKTMNGHKTIIPVCLKCNENGRAQAIIHGTKQVLPDDTITKDLINCKHESISTALYTHERVVDVEKNSKKCTVLQDTEKSHISACFDGKTYATIVCKLAWKSKKGKCCSCKGSQCGHRASWYKELRAIVLKEDNTQQETADEISSNCDDESDSIEVSPEAKEEVEDRPKMKFPPTETTKMMFRKYETEYYDKKDNFVDEHNGEHCLLHGNEWSDLDPIEMGWCFANEVKIAHTTFVRKKDRKVFFRKTDQQKCDCQLMYQGDQDFLLRIGGSTERKLFKSVTLISYGLLTDFTLDFMENGTTMTGFHKAYSAKCKMKYGMPSSEVISLTSWKKAVGVFWKDILTLDMVKNFTCGKCGDLPSTLVFDGIALGVQIEKIKTFQDRMQLVLGRNSKTKLSGTNFEARTFIRSRKNKEILKEAAANIQWPTKKTDETENDATEDSGMDGFWKMVENQDRSQTVPEGLVLLMRNLSTSTSTSNLFQVKN